MSFWFGIGTSTSASKSGGSDCTGGSEVPQSEVLIWGSESCSLS